MILLALSGRVEAQNLDCSKITLPGIPTPFNLTYLATYPGDFVAGDNTGIYNFRVCGNVICGGGLGAGCQEATSGGNYAIGIWSPDSTVAYYSLGIIFVTQPMVTIGGSGTQRAARIHVICDPTAKEPTDFGAIGHPLGSDRMFYDLFLSHYSACKPQ